MTANEDERMIDKRAASRMSEGADGKTERPTPAVGQEPEAEPAGAEGDANQDELLAAERDKAEAYYKNWQRSAADFINYKRRVEQERGESARLASAALAINLLPVYDDLERAVNTVDAALAGLNWVQGIVAIQRKFQRLLEAMDVKEVAASGEQFDPARHEAVGQQPGDEGKVLHVVQKGYTLGERVIRPAMVIVGDGAKS
jgi:molecular chaperone GrpE